MLSRSLSAFIAIGVLGLAGCCQRVKLPEVKRLDEAERFRSTLVSRSAALKIDPAKPLAMEQCVQLALENNLDQKTRELHLSLQDEKVKLAMAGWLPMGQALFQATHRNNKALASFGGITTEMEDQNLQSFTLSGIVPILDWGATYCAYQIAKDKAHQEMLTLERSRQTLARDVRAAYARLAGLLRQEGLARVGLLAARELLRQAQSLEREGLNARAETAAIEAGLAQAALQWSAIRRGTEQARVALAQTMSLPPGVTFAIDDKLPPLRPLVSAAEIQKLEQSALEARPELRVQDREQRIAAATVRQTYAQFFPHLDGIFSFNWTSQSTLVNPAFFRGGFQIASSLLDGGTQLWNYARDKKTVSVEAERMLLLSLGIMYEVDMRALQVFAAYDAMIARQAVVKSQQEALKQMVSLYMEGMETGTNTVRTLAEMYVARLLLDQTQTDYQVACYELDTAALADAPRPAEAVPSPGARPATPLPPLDPAAALDTLQRILEMIPPMDLRQYPELEGLMKASRKPAGQP